MENIIDSAISREEMEAKLKEFRDWIDEQLDMPKKFENLLLLRYLKISRWRVEKAQRILKLTLQLRTDNTQIFANRDPLSQEIKDIFEAVDMVPLSNTTPENYKICVFRLTRDDDVDHIEFNDLVKAFFMMSDVRLITPDVKLSDGEISIFDMSKVSYRHFTKIVISTVRLYLRYIQEAHPVRVRQIHIINCNPIIDKIVTLIKPFVRTENFQMINFHTPDSETLFDFIPREFLPNELSGSGGSIETFKAEWMARLEKHRDYLKDDEVWRLIEDENNNNEIKGGGVLDFLGIF